MQPARQLLGLLLAEQRFWQPLACCWQVLAADWLHASCTAGRGV